MAAVIALPVEDEAVRPRRRAALALIEEMRGGKSSAVQHPIAGPLAEVTRAAIERAIPYAGSGGQLEAQLDVEHHGIDGSRTTARLQFRYHR